MIITIAGPSGAGKSTLAEGIFQALPSSRPLESVTTRARRGSDGALGESTYEFVSNEAFEAAVAREEFLWHVEAYGNKYGTRKATIDAALGAGVFVSILVLDAVEKLYEYALEREMHDSVKWLYLELKDESEFARRLAARKEAAEEIARRTADHAEWARRITLLKAPFHFLDAGRPREEVLAHALAYLSGETSEK